MTGKYVGAKLCPGLRSQINDALSMTGQTLQNFLIRALENEVERILYPEAERPHLVEMSTTNVVWLRNALTAFLTDTEGGEEVLQIADHATRVFKDGNGLEGLRSGYENVRL